MKSTDMAEVAWTTEMEIDLLYAMMDHKPVGQNKVSLNETLGLRHLSELIRPSLNLSTST